MSKELKDYFRNYIRIEKVLNWACGDYSIVHIRQVIFVILCYSYNICPDDLIAEFESLSDKELMDFLIEEYNIKYISFD